MHPDRVFDEELVTVVLGTVTAQGQAVPASLLHRAISLVIQWAVGLGGGCIFQPRGYGYELLSAGLTPACEDIMSVLVVVPSSTALPQQLARLTRRLEKLLIQRRVFTFHQPVCVVPPGAIEDANDLNKTHDQISDLVAHLLGVKELSHMATSAIVATDETMEGAPE